jgi:eukaryotic-like serine/threonine-protein kinase
MNDPLPELPGTRLTSPGETPTGTGLPAPDAAPTVLPQQVGRYRIEGEIGRGGMGLVLLGRDPDLNRTLAIKVLLDKYRGQADVERRFLEEVQVTAQLQHPGIPPVHEVGRLEDGRPFFSMKLVKGRTLAELLKERRDLAENLPRFLAVCQAVGFAHSRGILHRDLKPSNVMVGAFGEVQVMDWGLAKVLAREGPAPVEEPSTIFTVRTAADGLMSQAGTVVGTPAYMAPEQARAEAHLVDERTDVFGLGALLCVLLTGEPPYPGPGTDAAHRQAARADLAGAWSRLDTCRADPELVRLAKACLAPEREQRPRDAGTVAEMVGAYLAGVEQRLRRAELDRAAAEARAEEEKRTRQVAEAKAAAERRARRMTLGLAVAVLLLLGGGGIGAWLWQQQRAEAAQRRRDTDEAVRLAMDEARRLARQAREAPLTEMGRYYQEAVGAGRRAAELARTGEASREVRGEAHDLEEELGAELRAAEKDRRLLTRLLDVRGLRETSAYRKRGSGPVAVQAEPSADEQFAQAFHDWGLDVDATPMVEAVAWLEARPPAVVAEVVAALDEWAVERRLPGRPPSPAWRRLADLAAALDTAGPRHELRAILARGRLTEEGILGELTGVLLPWSVLTGQVPGADRNRLRALARQTDAAAEPVLGVLLLARALEAAGDGALAEGLLRAAARARPGEVVLHTALGNLLEQQQPPRWAEAVECYAAARAVRPELGVTLARALASAGRSAEGLAVCQELLRLQPDNPVLHFYRGNILARQGKYKEAEAAYRRAIALKDDFAEAHNGLGVALAHQDRLKEAEAVIRKVIDLKPANPVLRQGAPFALAGALFYSGQREKGLAAYREALREYPNSADGLEQYGNALKELGRVDEAIAAYRKAVRVNTKSAKAYNSLGALLCDHKRDYAGAVKAFREASRLAPGYAMAYFNLGNALGHQGQWEEAAAAYLQALVKKPDYASARYNLGIALAAQGKVAEAMADFRRAAELFPPGPDRVKAEARVQYCQRFQALDEKLPRVLRRDEKAGAAELLDLAVLCQQYKKRYAAAARLYADAFAAEPKQAADLSTQHRYNAACVAALAAAGKGNDAGKLSAEERTKWRKQALQWLRDDLAAWAQVVERAPPQARPVVQRTLAHWQKDTDLDSVREEASLEKLPAAERDGWKKLWAEVEALRKKAETK